MQPNARRGGARGGGRSHWGGRGDSRNTPSRDEETSAFRDNRRRRNSQDDGQKARGGRSRSSQRQNGSQQAAPEVRAIHQKTPPPKTNSSQVRTRLDRDSAGWEQIWRERFEQVWSSLLVAHRLIHIVTISPHALAQKTPGERPRRGDT